MTNIATLEDESVVGLVEAGTGMRDAIERMTLRIDKEPGNQTVVSLWLHHVRAWDAALAELRDKIKESDGER